MTIAQRKQLARLVVAGPEATGYARSLWTSPWSCYPWLNVRLSLQYVTYFTFDGAARNYDGAGRDAWDNNTLYLLGWVAF